MPKFGSTGTSAAVTFGLGVRVMVRLRWAVGDLDMPSPWIHLARLAVACFAGLYVVSAMRIHGPFAAALCGLLVYISVVVVCGAFGRHPLHELRANIALLTKQSH